MLIKTRKTVKDKFKAMMDKSISGQTYYSPDEIVEKALVGFNYEIYEYVSEYAYLSIPDDYYSSPWKENLAYRMESSRNIKTYLRCIYNHHIQEKGAFDWFSSILNRLGVEFKSKSTGMKSNGSIVFDPYLVNSKPDYLISIKDVDSSLEIKCCPICGWFTPKVEDLEKSIKYNSLYIGFGHENGYFKEFTIWSPSFCKELLDTSGSYGWQRKWADSSGKPLYGHKESVRLLRRSNNMAKIIAEQESYKRGIIFSEDEFIFDNWFKWQTFDCESVMVNISRQSGISLQEYFELGICEP